MEVQELIHCSIIRGGTSKAVFFLRNDLPSAPELRDRIILRVFGAPDVREIDGLGGADSLTSKVGVIGPSTRSGCDIDYLFGQVSLTEPMIDWKSNCGNISAAVGPFAIDEGFIEPKEPVTVVRIHQVNTGRVIVAEVPVKNGRAAVEGDHAIDGVPGTGAKIILDFSDSAGAITGKLLPTGKVKDVIDVEGIGQVEVSLIDAAIPTVFIEASSLGLKGNESPQEIDSDSGLLDRIERIRSVAAQKMGLVEDWHRATREVPYSPFFAICSPPASYLNWTTGTTVKSDSVDIVARLLFMQKMHKAYPVTGTVCTTVASLIDGTIANKVCRAGVAPRGELRIGHPSGIIVPEGRVDEQNGNFIIKRATVDRTARCIMKGYALIPKSTLK